MRGNRNLLAQMRKFFISDHTLFKDGGGRIMMWGVILKSQKDRVLEKMDDLVQTEL